MSKSIKLIFNYFLAPLLFIVLCWTLYKQIINQEDLAERWLQVRQSWKNPVFWIVFFLMFINWGIESYKWKVSLAALEKISFFKAFRSVLAGCSITMLTPNRIGEYGGRIIYLKEQNRFTAISVTILGSMSQLMITMLVGTFSIICMKEVTDVDIASKTGSVLLIISIVTCIILLLAYFRVATVVKVLEKLPFTQKIVKHLLILSGFSGKLLLRILFLSFLRYLIFILQYILVLKVMKVSIPFADSFLLIAVFYLVMAIAPTAGFIELPVRAVASVQLFSIYSDNTVGIQAAAFAIWMINLVLPAILGSIMIFGVKILNER